MLEGDFRQLIIDQKLYYFSFENHLLSASVIFLTDL